MRVKIRGIYSTSLTNFFHKKGMEIVSPSRVIRERFKFEFGDEFEDVLIRDKEDRQGIRVEGIREGVERVIESLKESFPHVIVREVSERVPEISGKTLKWDDFKRMVKACYEVEFPLPVKKMLDEIRGEITYTIKDHHLLKVIDAERVEMVEERGEDGERLKREIVYSLLKEGRSISLFHIKPDGERIVMRGRIVSFDEGERKLVMERRFKGGGVYDGLGVRKEEGDYGFIELREGEWFVRRVYFSKNGELKGEIYNINTPVELYGTFIRYIDLEVDVVNGKLEDVDVLERRVEEGLIPPYLKEKALEVGRRLVEG